MWHGRGPRLLVCVAAVVAVVALHAYGERSLGGLQVSEPQDVIAVHADGVAGAVAFRTEQLTRDEAERSATRLGSLVALGGCALGLLAVGHRRRGVVLAGALPGSAVARPPSSPRAPPLRLS
jgi:hypothetical protein